MLPNNQEVKHIQLPRYIKHPHPHQIETDDCLKIQFFRTGNLNMSVHLGPAFHTFIVLAIYALKDCTPVYM